ncbi:MAG TPA: hypothetical protein DCQ96_14735, partial [Verrucomicrobiales bacterium]|nr:hypothetical protein [Verrucomicrobiales bacterium]
GSVHFQFGEIFLRQNREAEALSSFLTSLKYTPKQIAALNRVSWLLATAGNSSVRNGAESLRYAKFMMQAPGATDDPALLSTLAAAHAAANQFPAAIQTTLKVIALLEAGQRPDKQKEQQERLKLYQQGKTLPSPLGRTAP